MSTEYKEERNKEVERKEFTHFINSLADVIRKYGVQLLEKREDGSCIEKEKNVSCTQE